jgi:hypothetical protein
MTMKKTLNVLVPSVLALFVASAAHAGATFDTPQGKLNIGGDVEYDLTADNFSENTSSGVADATDTQSLGGRILLDINGERVLSNGNFAGFKINPVYTTNGDYGDGEDAWFTFGVKSDWAVKLGHYEAYDLSPAGQDTYVVGYGDELYRAKAARGRANSGSQAMFSKEAGQWHMELSTLFGDDNGMYDSYGVVKNKDPLIARPVVAWTGETVTVAAGAELNLIPDAYTTGAHGEGEEISDWTGYGLTTTVKANDDLSFTMRGAYRDADEGDGYSFGPGVAYQNFYIAYLNGQNTDSTGTDDVDTKYNVAYASYKIPAVMGIDNFDMYLGASWGDKKVGDNDTTDELGGRVRFKYFF